MRARSLLLVAALLAPAGCGGGSSVSHPVRHGAPMPGAGEVPQVQAVPEGHGRANPKVVAVIRAWSDALRRSSVTRATAYFAIPSIVQGSLDQPPVEVRSRKQARAFNTALPCGARLLRAVAAGPYTIGSFLLSERPGTRCDGPGVVARAAFRVRAGKIVEWRRVSDLPQHRQAAPGTASTASV